MIPGVSRLLVGTHCGVERLGLPVNDVFWITDEATRIRLTGCPTHGGSLSTAN